MTSPTTPRWPPGLDRQEREHRRMRVVAERRAAVAAPKWGADVLACKLTIADGAGEVPGRRYDLRGAVWVGFGAGVIIPCWGGLGGAGHVEGQRAWGTGSAGSQSR